MKTTLIASILTAAVLSASPGFAEGPDAGNKGNCELRLVSHAGAGEILLSIFTPTEEDCLSKADKSVEAKYRNPEGNVVSKRGGAGPRP